MTSSQDPRSDRPDIEEAMAVDAVPDEVRTHGSTDETETKQTEHGAVPDHSTDVQAAQDDEETRQSRGPAH